MKSALRVAVEGIDGAGKSTVVAKMQEDGIIRRRGWRTMTCPHYHRTPDLPFAELSRQLDALTEVADATRDYPLKAATLFLQMTLFGPIERFVVDTYAPSVLLSERHALVAALAYGSFYASAVDRSERPASRAAEGSGEAELQQRLASVGGIGRVLDWHASEQRRLGNSTDFWELPLEVARLLRRPRETLLEELKRRFRARLPDVVILLDIPAELAAKRTADREGGDRELHEEVHVLERLRSSYIETLAWLESAGLGVRTIVVDVSSSPSPDELVETTLRHLDVT